MRHLTIDIWSDIACPWCYIGKRRLEAALARFQHRDAVDVTWHSFELDPRAPATLDPSVPYAARLARKYGTSVEAAEGMITRMTETGAGDGLELRFDRVRPGNTFDAHRLLHQASTQGREAQGAMKERLLRAYMTEGEEISDRATLVRLAAETGLDGTDVAAMLASDAHGAAVRADEEQARALGIGGVPFFVIDRKYGISGAQPADGLLAALEQAWAELAPDEGGEGDACGPEGCPQ